VEQDSEIDRLYGLPLDEFIRERDELAKRLRREGDREAAEGIKQLRKPSAGAWALNQAVRRRRKETDALLAAGERLRSAHEALLSGGDPATLREAMQEERALAGALADCAEAIASETGKSGAALRERVRSTLHAASVDEEAREELVAGRFIREREAVGLGPFGGEAPALGRAKRAAGGGAKPATGGREGAARGRGRSAPARERSAPGRRRSTSARDRPAPARERSAAAREEAAARERQERLAKAERALGDARTALEEAEASHSTAAGELDGAREALRAAEAVERDTRQAARELRRDVAKRERELERLRARRR
jgi:hypothetical protein